MDNQTNKTMQRKIAQPARYWLKKEYLRYCLYYCYQRHFRWLVAVKICWCMSSLIGKSECQKQIKNTKLNHTNTIKFFKVSTTVLICEFVHWSIREEDQRTENCQLDSPPTHECNYNTTNDYCNSQSTSRRRTSWLQSCTEIWFRTSTFVFFL